MNSIKEFTPSYELSSIEKSANSFELRSINNFTASSSYEQNSISKSANSFKLNPSNRFDAFSNSIDDLDTNFEFDHYVKQTYNIIERKDFNFPNEFNDTLSNDQLANRTTIENNRNRSSFQAV